MPKADRYIKKRKLHIQMEYENISKKRYETMWSQMKGKFHGKRSDYRSNYPLESVKDFADFLKKKGKILDIGCGNGRNTIVFAKKGSKAYGIDFSAAAISLAEKNAKENKAKAEFSVGSALELPYEKDMFDAAIDCGCFHHIRKSGWEQYIENLLKVLKKGGYYYLHCFSTSSEHIPKFSPKERNWINRKGHYSHFFTEKEIKEIFAERFRILKVYRTKKEDTGFRFLNIYMKKK